MGTGKLSGKPDEMLRGSDLEIKRHPIQGGVVILLVTSGHGNWDKLIVTWFAYY